MRVEEENDMSSSVVLIAVMLLLWGCTDEDNAPVHFIVPTIIIQYEPCTKKHDCALRMSPVWPLSVDLVLISRCGDLNLLLKARRREVP